ncbi:MAG TPA: RidA family protein [Polyangia bacterium]|nr:RidA family protein [Polyangia bacterium]
MSVRTINPLGLAPGRGYANGAQAGGIVAIAGQIGWDQAGRMVSDDMAAQFEQALANVVAVVRSAGLGPSDVLQMRIYVTDKREYAARSKDIGAAWRRHMGRHYPAMALVQVAALLEDAAKVEIEALAVDGGGRRRGPFRGQP